MKCRLDPAWRQASRHRLGPFLELLPAGDERLAQSRSVWSGREGVFLAPSWR